MFKLMTTPEQRTKSLELLATIRNLVATDFPVSAARMEETVTLNEHQLPALMLTLPNGYSILAGTDLDWNQELCLVVDAADPEGEPDNGEDGYSVERIATFIKRYLTELRDAGMEV